MRRRPWTNTVDRNVNRPTIQSTISTPTATRTSIDVSWTGGNGSNHLVVARLGNGVSFTQIPTDGTVYTSNSAFGSGSAFGGGYVVYLGTGTSTSVTGLTSNTYYTFEVYEVSASGYIYLTSTSVNKISKKTSL